MPKQGEYNLNVPIILKEQNKIKLLEPFRGSKQHHQMKCLVCDFVWNATPLSKIQTYKKYKVTGCPECRKQKRREKNKDKYTKIITSKGFLMLEPYKGYKTKIKVKNPKCNHTFSTTPEHIVGANVNCPICATKLRTQILNKSSKSRSKEWHKTASEWRKYKSKVVSLTAKTYRKHKDTINPNNLTRGKAGVEGAFHLDHIVPIRYCFDHQIPVHLCAHQNNLCMLEWEENVSSRDKIKQHLKIPEILEEYIKMGPTYKYIINSSVDQK